MYKQWPCHPGTGKGLHLFPFEFSGQGMCSGVKNYKNEFFLFYLFLFCNFTEIIKGGKDEQRKN